MLPRCFLRNVAVSPTRMLRITTSVKFIRSSVVRSSPKEDEKTKHSNVVSHSALQRQQLEFCCLLCDWDVQCNTCPFNWFNFNPKKVYTKHQQPHIDMNQFTTNNSDIQQAIKILDIHTSTSSKSDKISFSQQQLKDAFRVKALKYHPDCNPDMKAEPIFKDILAAYTLLLLSHTR